MPELVNAQKMREVAQKIKEELPGKGFALVVFDFGEGMRDFNYISTGQREDMIATFEALLLKWKNQKVTDN